MGRRSSSSKGWLKRQRTDAYVARSRAAGYRSRAAYKLLEIDTQVRVLRPGICCVDLGAAPGGWSQVAAERVAPGGRVVALDVLPMAPIPGVDFIQGDFTESETLAALRAALGAAAVHLVMSDMAPNISGNRAVDQARAMHLAELALELAREVLGPGGSLLVKLFQGEGFEAYRRTAQALFGEIKFKKPPASRRKSREMYLLARNLRI
jgi:23S rRNA (uridine2552-2'-O)-methyltransferase